MVITMDKVRFWYDLGYVGDVPLDVPLLVGATVLQLVCEVVVDLMCVYVERMNGLDVERAWDDRFRGFGVAVFFYGLVAFVLFLVGFERFPPACPDTEYFCMCYDQLDYNVHQHYCDGWLNETDFGASKGLNRTDFGL